MDFGLLLIVRLSDYRSKIDYWKYKNNIFIVFVNILVAAVHVTILKKNTYMY